MTKSLPTPELLRKLMRYEQDTGLLFWLERPVEMFSDGKWTAERSCAIWNGRFAGAEAFMTNDGHGYRQGAIFGRNYRANRVIWAMETDAWPKDQVDHEDHDRSNNRFENLREVTSVENNQNRKLPSTNTSGTVGVYWNKQADKWQAFIRANNKRIHLGRFTGKSDAIAARAAANIKYGFHPNHGRSA